MVWLQKTSYITRVSFLRDATQTNAKNQRQLFEMTLNG